MLPLLLVLAGCTLLEEQRTAATSALWSGWVYADLPSTDTPLLEYGTLQAVDLDDVTLADGTQSDANPGYWSITLPVDTDVALRVDGGSEVPTVWRSRTPTGPAYWLSGGLFAVADTTAADMFAAIDGWQGFSPADLADGEVAHLWGSPLDPDAWAGATVTVTDSSGERPVALLAVDEDGLLIDAGAGPIDYVLAPDLLPGTVTLTVSAADGTGLTETWPARGGDLLAAFFLALGTTG